MDVHPQDVSTLLESWNAGDQAAGNELIGVVYKELRRLASHCLQSERPDHTLQPTALVHEVYLKLFDSEPLQFRDRGHFLAIVSRQLRRIVIDYARAQQSQKRGGQRAKLSLEDVSEPEVFLDGRILEIDEVLERLSELDPRSAKVVELRYFGGLTEQEIAAALEISPATVKRDWEFARSWLLKELQ